MVNNGTKSIFRGFGFKRFYVNILYFFDYQICSQLTVEIIQMLI